MIVASYVVKNEADRYFESSIVAVSKIVDKVFVFDDNSTDSTVDIALNYSAHVAINDGVSFMEHEGLFRYAAWKTCIESLELTSDDWILVVDADEFPALEGKKYKDSSVGNLSNDIASSLKALSSTDRDSYKIHIPDVRQKDGKSFKVRVDGLWGKNHAPRFCRAVDEKFMNKKMGSFSIPEKLVFSSVIPDTDFRLLHFGHLEEDDMLERYKRYTSLKNHGHNKKHIESLIKVPKLESWYGGCL